jgi:glucose-specific phosphotransferase system IIA component
MSKKKSKAFAVLQKVGKSLMLPVSVLPAAGLLVAFGRMVQNAGLDANGEVANAMLNAIGSLMFQGGIAIFEQLPLIFAIGVAIGFTGGAAVSGLAAAVGYFTMANVLKIMGTLRELPFSIETGVFGGILIGLVAANLYNRFYKTKLHPVLGFFEGKRLVPILMAFASLFLGIALGFIWPPIQNALNAFGTSVVDAQVGGFSLAGGIFAAGNRALIPTGLHHVFYAPFLFDFGSFTDAAGQVFRGESARYFAGDITAGNIMASEYPLKIFGLPAAALAMTLTAKKKNRKAVGGVMLTAALTSIITGITEPIEFAFIFVAPVLYLAHIILAFVGGFLINLFQIRLGYTFTSSLIDFGISYFNAGNPWKLFYIVGPLIGVMYFVVFYYLIKKFDLQTPGRGEDMEEGSAQISASDKAREVLIALGGAANIIAIDACITRLRLEVKETVKVNKDRLKALGSAGVMDAGGGSLQVVFGTEAEGLKDEIKSLMQAAPAAVSGLSVVSPTAGKIIPLSKVPDETFAGKLIGDGVAIEPKDGVFCSPVDGEIVNLFPTKHAIGIRSTEGVEILLHVGIDTVNMKGEGFEAFIKAGDKVKAGDKLLKVDLDKVAKEAKSIISPIVITNGHDIKGMNITSATQAQKGSTLIEVQK